MRRAPGEQRLARIHELELKRRNLLHRTELLHRDEEARRATVGWLSLKDENAILQDELQQSYLERHDLKEGYDSLVEQLSAAQQTARSREAKLKQQHGELSSLQAEVEHMGSSVQDSGKLMQEKLSQTRELDRLRPELEHLQAQLTNHQAVVAEKHRLQRQLNSVEVELENEKRSRQRAQDKENKTLVDELKARVEHSNKCLASERKEKEKLKSEHEVALSEANGLSDRLNQKLAEMKANLLKSQAELKTAQAELGRRQANPIVVPTAVTGATSLAPSKARSNKRGSEESVLQEVTFETPGAGNPSERFAGKKRGGKYAPVGEKSSFSVTPFLNRNKNATSKPQGARASVTNSALSFEKSDPNPGVEQDEEILDTGAFGNVEDAPVEPQVAPSPKAAKAQKPRGRPKANQLAKAPSSTARDVSRAEATSVQDEHVLGKGRSGEDSMDQEVSFKAPVQPEDVQPKLTKRAGQSGLGLSAGEADGKKKRRKLLGAGQSTLFDDEGEEEPIPTQNRLGQAAKRKKAPLGGLSNAFASTSFSPLKRDRRGVGASFLA